MSAFQTAIGNGSPANRVDIVFAGDGYRSSEIATTYASHVSALSDYLFSGNLLSQPFGRYKNFFNVHRVNVVSDESGADDPSTSTFRNTALDAAYRWDGVTQRLLYVSESKTDAAIADALSGTGIDPEMTFVAVNDTQYGGGGGRYAVYAGGNQSSLEIALHEVGHSFARLADEYGGSTTPYDGAEPIGPNVTADPTGGKWAHWIGYDQPGIGSIGAYEGGQYHDFGIYRPSLDSKMRSLDQPFDAVGREQFILRIYDYVDPIDAHTDNSARLVNTDAVFVDVIDPAVIKVRWSVDGKTIRDGGVYAFDLSDQGYGLGAFAVTALAYDDTDWVRTDPARLQQSVAWTVDVPTGATTGPDNLTGTERIDRIFGLAGNDTVPGLGGDDMLSGDAGNDIIDGGLGADRMEGGTGNDSCTVDNPGDAVAEATAGALGGTDIVTSTVTFTLGPNIENLTLSGAAAINGTGNSQANKLTGNAAANRLLGSGGNDTLNGGAGADRMEGGAGNDLYYIDRGQDAVIEAAGQGTDRIVSPLSYSLAPLANVENLTLTGAALNAAGNALANVLVGNGAANALSGAAGNDVLAGGAGNDLLQGGAGNDRFVFADRGGDDRISGFAAGAGTGDVIDLRSDAQIGSFADVLARTVQAGADCVIDLGQGDSLTLLGVAKASLVAADFLV